MPKLPPKHTLTSETLILTVNNVSILIFLSSSEMHFIPVSMQP